MISIPLEYLDKIIDPIFNPQKRLFIGYLLSAFIIAVIFLSVKTKGGIKNFRITSISYKRWYSRSARADYVLMLFNQVLFIFLAPKLVTKLMIATLLFECLHIWFDGRSTSAISTQPWIIALAFTATLFLVDDMTKYILHRALHKVPFLWCFHKVHHSAEVLTPFTVYRTHPIEGVLFGVRNALVQGVTISCFFYFFGNQVQLITVLGTSTFLFIFNALGANLRHSHVWLRYGSILEHIIISPAQHQTHHSAADRHVNTNYGAVLAIWDWAGKTLYVSDTTPPARVGLAEGNKLPHKLTSLWLMPLRDSMTYLISTLKKVRFSMPSLTLEHSRKIILATIFAAIVGLTSVSTTNASAEELNIYSHRQPFLINPFLKEYTDQTGIKFNVVYASKGLAQRLLSEGRRSPADIILTVDISRLYVYADKNLLASIDSKVLENNVPKHLRDTGNRWFAFSKRARVIAVSTNAKDARSIKRYEDLADPKWSGRICSRPGSHVYNRALVASLIHSIGVERTEKWANGLIKNLARRPQGNDRAQIKAIHEGVCDIAIINNYYYGKLKHSKNPQQRMWAAGVKLIFPNQSDRGTHINISGGGVAKHSKNKERAVKFLEFLTSKNAQNLYAKINFEYPVNQSVPVSNELRSWGMFKEDSIPIEKIALLSRDGQKLIDRVGW